MTERNGDWIETYTGLKFWPMDPRPEEICIEDIAHALANLCRFGGHVREFYSVAQHSVCVAGLVPPEHGLWGLLHDAAEAYLIDLPRPIKYSAGMAGYLAAEAAVQRAVCVRFGLEERCPALVKWADDVACAVEARDLMTTGGKKWNWPQLNLPRERTLPLEPSASKTLFLLTWGKLQ